VHDTSSGETEFWSQRSAKFNMLYQQLSMNSVKRILQVSVHPVAMKEAGFFSSFVLFLNNETVV
jgi:hypothetical protein